MFRISMTVCNINIFFRTVFIFFSYLCNANKRFHSASREKPDGFLNISNLKNKKNMQDKTIKKVTIKHVKSVTGECCYIDDSLIMFEHFENLPFPLEPRKMNCVLVGMCLQGRAQYTVDTKECIIKENDILILSDGQVISDYMLSCDFKGIAMLASENFMQDISRGVNKISSLFIYAKTHPVLHLNHENAKSFLDIYWMTHRKVMDTSHRFRRDIVCSFLNALIYDMGNYIWYAQQDQASFKQNRGEKIFSDFLKLVEQNFQQIRRVGWYAEQLKITPKYLSETVKKVSRETPNSWIDSYVTTELRVQLKNTSKNIKEIARDMNFPNQSFLGKYFKDRTGMSPSSYRRS